MLHFPGTSRRPIACFLAAAFSASLTGAAEINTEAARALIRADIAAHEKDDGSRRVSELLSAESELARRLELTDWRDDSQLEETINAVMDSGASAKVRTQCRALLGEIKAREMEKQKQFAAAADVALHRLSDLIAKAKSASELDGVISELNELSRQAPEEDRRQRGNDRVLERLGYAVSDAQKWQEYLSLEENGNAAGAAQKLQDVADHERDSLYIPRSEILARIRALDPPANAQASAAGNAILADVHTLDDLPDAIAKFRADPRIVRSSGIYGVFMNLESICRAYLAWKEGAVASLSFSQNKPGDAYPLVVRLHTQLLLKLLPRVLGLGANQSPRDGEMLEAYLVRLTAEARAAGDWDELGRVLWARKEITLKLNGVFNSNTIDDYSAFLYFKQAQTQERAQQFAAATSAYRGALRDGGSGIPAEVIGARLAAIKKEHPAEFAEGMNLKVRGDRVTAPAHPDAYRQADQAPFPQSTPSPSATVSARPSPESPP